MLNVSLLGKSRYDEEPLPSTTVAPTATEETPANSTEISEKPIVLDGNPAPAPAKTTQMPNPDSAPGSALKTSAHIAQTTVNVSEPDNSTDYETEFTESNTTVSGNATEWQNTTEEEVSENATGVTSNSTATSEPVT